MRMNRMAALTLSAGMITMAACSDSPTAPTAKAKQMGLGSSSFDVGTEVSADVQLGKVIICKTGDVGGTFNLSNQLIVADAPSGDPTATQVTVAAGTCEIAYEDANPINGNGTRVTITEVPIDNTVQTLTACKFKAAGDVAETDCTLGTGDTRFINAYHGFTITYNNVSTPPTGCTYTKGWYQSKNATLTGVDGLSIEMEAAFFAATPNKTGSVSFVGPNNLLNLYQQLLAALENGGESGPTEVQDAIQDAQDGTSVSLGGELTTTLSNTEISALISTLSAFNEGTFENWPHC